MTMGALWGSLLIIGAFAVLYFSILSPLLKMAKEADKNQAKQQ